MLQWDKSITNYVSWQARRILWVWPAWELDDLVHEGWLVFDKLSKSHGREQLIEQHGEMTDARCRAAWMALFQTSLRNRFLNLARGARRRSTIELESESGTTSNVKRTAWFFSSSSIRSVEISCDLEKAPGIMRILESASWDDDISRMRNPRRLASGKRETRADVLHRLAGRQDFGDIDAQLSMVV